METELNKHKKLKLSKAKLSDSRWGYLMIAPTILGLIILNIWPLIQTFYLSFQSSAGFGITQFVGLDNYKKLIADPEVLTATINTFKYTLAVVPAGVFLSLIIAVLLNTNIKGKSLYRTIYFLPMIAAPAAIAMVWKWLFMSDFGLINMIFKGVGLPAVNWLTSGGTALFTVIVVGIWSSLGFNMIILLAGLQEIPTSFYEAAEIDGAGPVRKFFKITLPLVSPTMFFVVITTLIGSLQVFDYIFMMISKTNAALGSVQSLVYLFYDYSFIQLNKGYGSAIIVWLFIIIMVITAIQLKLQKKWVHYD